MSGPPRGWAALLAGLPAMAPRRLLRLLDLWGPEEAWARVTSGRLTSVRTAVTIPDADDPPPSDAVVAAWHARAAAADPAAELARHEAAGVHVLLRDDPAYPLALAEDLEPPAVLFAQGRLGAIDAPRVAIVGTRRCTGGAAAVARALGRDLAAGGVAVVSGLALGIDGAAHRGALAAVPERGDPALPIGVVATGHDRPYPARHRALWQAVGERGVLLGEVPLGSGPRAWRFPLRNRIIAALADLVVVVESHEMGGSLHTVRAAMERGRDVMAVPGSVRNAAAAGTNQLLAEGCGPVRDAQDVLLALGMLPGGRRTPPASAAPVDRRPPPDGPGQAVLDAFDWEPATLEHLALRTGQPIPALALALQRLEADGWVAGPGPWYERVGAR